MKNRIKELRKSLNISQRELAKSIGISQQAIANYENGRRTPKVEIWEKIANFFNVSVPELQGYRDEKITYSKLTKLITEKPNSDYTKAVVAENLRQNKILNQKEIDILIKQLNNLIQNNQMIDLTLLISLSKVFTELFNNKNDELYTELQTFLSELLGYIMHEDDRNESDVKESFQELLDRLNKEEK
nr:helix-turn-helix transcriptional regulator [uncultured Ligilactobacillus sp.]